MSCKINNKKCNPKSLICRLNPKDNGKTYRDLGDIEDRPFFNSKCSNFKKVE